MEVLTLKAVRISRDKTQQDMADMLGVHVQTYRKIEENPETATAKEIKMICDYLEISYELFLCQLTLRKK